MLEALSRWCNEFVPSPPTPDPRPLPLLVAVSGGADSVALLRGLAEIRGSSPDRIVAAHFNHRLRGRESDDDEAFVVEVGRLANVEVVVGRAAEETQTRPLRKMGPEAAARNARYAFLRQSAIDRGLRCVATAHTADDQIETILHRILRGTGLRGLSGIPKARRMRDGIVLVRPLLDVHRTEVRCYLESIGQAWREDSSNAEPRFTRNRIRNALLPAIARDFGPSSLDAILRLAALSTEAQAAIDDVVRDLAERCVESADERLAILDCGPLESQSTFLIGEVLHQVWKRSGWPLLEMSRRHWERAARVAQGLAPRCDLPAGLMIERRGGELRIARNG